jgi:hypothetical protein
VDLEELDPTIYSDSLGKRRDFDEVLNFQEDGDDEEDDEKPVFVETEESMKLTYHEKQIALDKAFGSKNASAINES